MIDFEYNLKTNISFGKNKINELPDILKQYGNKILIVYGGESIRKIGLYDTIYKLLKNFTIYELSGIQPNPKIESINKGVQICQKEEINVILAIGGGSVLDAAKAIGIGYYYQGNTWDLISKKQEIKGCLTLVGVLTNAASGSELGCGAVISNPETKEKLGIDYSDMYYQYMIMDPTYTITVSLYQTASGIIDIFSHLLEQYITNEYTLLSQLLCESVMKTVIYYSSIVLKEPENYEARAQIMWCASLANNGILSLGSQYSGWSAHAIEHEVSAFYDISHGVGLSVILPNWMSYVLNDRTVSIFARYAKEVWNIQDDDEYQLARKGIEKTKEFFKDLNIPTTLKELNIDNQNFDIIAQQAVKNGYLEYAFIPLTKDDIINILELCK